MDFNLTEERQMLADMAGRFVREQYPIDKRHKIAGSDEGFSREMWEQMAELGLIGALFPEEAGGFGGTGFDIAVIFEQLGRGLVVEPFLPTLLAGHALATSGNHGELIEAAIGGAALVAYAHGEPGSRYTLNNVATKAQKDGDGYRLTGHKAVVLGGGAADHLVVSARLSGGQTDRDGIGLFVVPGEAVTKRAYPTVDGYPAADIILDGVVVGSDALISDNAIELIEKLNALGALAVSAEATGAIDVAIDLTLDYLKTRKQFGRAIGTFQALQHRMADMMGEREQIRSAVINAAGHMDDGDRGWHVSAAKNLVGRSGRKIAEESIQMHGGIGMTWEYAIGHYAKRIVMIDHLFGDEDYHLARIVRANAA